MLAEAYRLRGWRYALPSLAILVLMLGDPLGAAQTRLASAHQQPLCSVSGAGAPVNTPTTTSTPSCEQGWRVVASPNQGTGSNHLLSTYALSTNDVWAVGSYYTNDSAAGPLIEHSTGGNWNIVPGPSVPGGALRAVSAVSPNDIWAVGTRPGWTGYPYNSSLIEHWNGTGWYTVTHPLVPGSMGQKLNGVFALSANDVWAVGYYISASSRDYTLTMHWDGAQWSIIPNPSIVYTSQLRSVSGASSNDVWAVGALGFDDWTVIMHWNGIEWSIVPSPNPGYYNRLNGVTVRSANDVWAVGAYESDGNGTHPLVAHWDGVSWAHIPTPVLNDSVLYGVSAAAPDDVWAVGSISNETLILHWDGSAWSRVSSPNAGSASNTLYSVSTPPGAGSTAWTTGNYSNSSGVYMTLVEKYTNTCPSATPTGTPPTATRTGTPGCTPTGSWSVITSPNPLVPETFLESVSALSPDDIWAAGRYNSSYGNSMTMMHWNGTDWDLSLIPSRPGESGMHGVAALGSDSAIAVGYESYTPYTTLALVMRRANSEWRPMTIPLIEGSYLYAVSALSASDIWAVGYSAATGGGPGRTLILHYDGNLWSVVPSPNNGLSHNALKGVKAIAANDVWAVGYYRSDSSGLDQTLTLHWNGANWSVVPSANAPTGASSLQAVHGVSANAVWAVGYATDQTTGHTQTLTERWDGSQWSLVSSPNPGTPGNILKGVATISGDHAWAVGSISSAGVTQTLTLRWDGSQWSRVNSPSPGSQVSALNAVVATSSSELWSVGYSGSPGGFETLTERFRYTSLCTSPTATGTPIATSTPVATSTPLCGLNWGIFPSPEFGLVGARLFTLSAISEDDIWMVGVTHTFNFMFQTLVERWNGSQWSIVTSINPSTNSYLSSVAAISPNNVWIAGHYYDYNIRTYKTLIERWNGDTFSVVSSPNVAGARNFLHDIAARSANDIWAVGYSEVSGSQTSQTLVLHYDGSAWSIIPSPNVGSGINQLSAVSAISANDVWAVGYHDDGEYTSKRTLTMHWNGSQWSVVPSPNPARGWLNELNGLAALASNDVWAVGNSYDMDSEETTTLIEHWNGAQWSIVPSQNPFDEHNYLYDVSARAANDVWTVGFVSESGTEQNMVQHWNGAVWTTMNTPRISHDAGLGGVVAVSPTDVWAVGYYRYFDNGTYYDRTLVERYFDPCGVTISPTPTPTYTATSTVTSTPTPRCLGGRFSDVCPADYFYEAVTYLADNGIITGYSDGMFRPFNSTTRGQLCKIIVLAEGWPLDTQGGPHFTDVPAAHSFYSFVETAYNRQVISGYSDRTFRPGNSLTRAQLCKITVLAEGWPTDTSGGPHFSDVLPVDTFYLFIETAFNRHIISGYADGTFQPGNNATRGQICKIVYQAIIQP